ncbi:MAG TPA: TatD family hydrolase [Rhodocyclaceae bacterium]|nr:TatD family hydrolase [Rhodocyclaceae bacterium]
MLVDSHCHIDFHEYHGKEAALFEAMAKNQVDWLLLPGVTLERFPVMLALSLTFENVFLGVGVHPDTETEAPMEPDVETLVRLSRQPKVVAIGETGLDYYRLKGDLEWQRERFRVHIRAAREANKPLIVHTRSAAEDTLRLLKEEGADAVGGVFHCFTETQQVAEAALEMGFYISFSGIVTFKNAKALKEIAKWVPLDRLLVETDAPYLAPAPHRGQVNQPAWVRHVAEEVAHLRGMSLEALAAATTQNFFNLFKAAQRV